MIRDRELKQKTLRYIVAKRWFPQLEVDVLFKGAVSSSSKMITDVDVLALIPDEFCAFRKLIIDCKTGRKESPVSRVLWLRGLMDQISADQGMCVLRKDKIEQDHRYNAAQLQIVLLSEQEFEKYSSAGGVLPFHQVGHLAEIDLWQRYFDIPVKYPSLAKAIAFSKTTYWMSETESEGCRNTIAQLRILSPELDPKKKEHIALVADFVSLFMASVARVVIKVFAEYLQPDRKEDLSEALLLLLYGGRDAYEFRNKLLKAYASSKLNLETQPELAPPVWDGFIQLIRQSLDAPFEVAKSPLLIREIGWSYLADSPNLSFATKLTQESAQAARLAVIGSDYLCRACRLPPEFLSEITAKLLEVQKPVNGGTTPRENPS